MHVMGNTSGNMITKINDYCGSPGERSCVYDQDYLPMSSEMKKILVSGRRIRRVLPGRLEEDTEKESEKGIKAEKLNSEKDIGGGMPARSEEPDEQLHKEERDKPAPTVKVKPVVTVVNMASLVRPNPDFRQEKDYSLEANEAVEAAKPSPAPYPPLTKSPQLTNRKYSVVDIKTGVRKSRFTLQLEEKLRQSKLELGFDADLDPWKEFKFNVENPEEKNIPNVETKNVPQVRTGKLNDPISIFPHNCQILGLCSIGKGEHFENNHRNDFHNHPSVLEDKITKEYNFSFLNNGEPVPTKREVCNCDVCNLAYLTGMGLPVQCENLVEKRRILDDYKNHREEKFKILDVKDEKHSIQVSLIDKGLGSSSSSPSVNSSSVDGDCTNLKIKKMFKKHTRERHHEGEINNRCLTYNEISTFTDRSRNDHTDKISSSPPHKAWRKSPDRSRRKSRPLGLKRSAVFGLSSPRKTSSSTTGPSFSSSLSTVLSYCRVRQIFQTFIEKNCSRKMKRNIKTFKEMEELGLGEVKNNRWYPSDSKTLSIWNDLHSNVRGCQAQFKQFPKVSHTLRK